MKRLLPIILLTTLPLSAQKAQWVVKPKYEGISAFTEGISAVQSGGKWGYATDRGKEILAPAYDVVYPFSEGLGVIASADHSLIAIADRQGQLTPVREKLKIDSRFATFNDGLLLVSNGKKWGYLNASGKMAIDCKYISAQPFSEGLGAVLLNEYWFYIGTNGATMVRPNVKKEIYWALGFHEGKALLLYKNSMGYIDASGRELSDRLPQITPPADGASYKEKTLVCKEGELLFDQQSRATAFVTAQGERTVFIPPAGKNGEALDIVKAANGRFGAIAHRQESPLAFALEVDTAISVFGHPAPLEYLIRNTSPLEMENLEVKLNGKPSLPLASIAPGGESRYKLLVDKVSEDPVEIRELHLAISEYGLSVGEDKRQVPLKSVTAIGIDIPADNVLLQAGQASYPLDIRLENLSSIPVDRLDVSVGSQKRTIRMDAGESRRVQFNIPATMQTVNVVVKPPGSPQVSKSKRINVRQESTQPPLTPDSARLSKQIIIQ
ncbi:MAG: WG repeat-containing protein [Tannerellaceae bacterium]|jgi:hypothetical protein|nr:WG repeat-containing protein [Tannerellaceae bacterium]